MSKLNLFATLIFALTLIFTGCGESGTSTEQDTAGGDSTEVSTENEEEVSATPEESVSGDAAPEETPATEQGQKTIETLLEEPLRTAFTNSSLAQTLASGEYTIFMPTKEAIEAIKDQLSDPAAVEKILKNHIVAQKIGLADMNPDQELETLGGTKLKLSNKEGIMHINDVEILEDSDVEIKNGYVHKIGKLLN